MYLSHTISICYRVSVMFGTSCVTITRRDDISTPTLLNFLGVTRINQCYGGDNILVR